jgi:hypothetical protein
VPAQLLKMKLLSWSCNAPLDSERHLLHQGTELAEFCSWRSQTLPVLSLACLKQHQQWRTAVRRAQVDGKPVGPQRVWPGGLAMGRTLGDASAGSVVTCEPEARQVLLPCYTLPMHPRVRLVLRQWQSVLYNLPCLVLPVTLAAVKPWLGAGSKCNGSVALKAV